MKKRIIAAVLVGTMLLAMTACTGNTQTNTETENSAEGSAGIIVETAAPEAENNNSFSESAAGDADESTAGNESSSSGEDEETEPADGLVNDAMYDVTEDELVQITGITLPAPDGAENVTYNIIGASTDTPIAEMEFTLNGTTAYLRAMSTSKTSIKAELGAAGGESYNISGLYYNWTDSIEEQVLERPGVSHIAEQASYIAWIDLAPGILYNLGVESEITEEDLLNLAETIFVPTQSDS